MLFRCIKFWKLEIGSLNIRNGTFLLELCSSVGVHFRKGLGADPLKKMVKMVGSWHAQEIVSVMLQNRLPKEWRRWGRGRPGTAPASPTGKAAAEARGRILGAGDRPGGGSCPEQVLSSSEWKMPKLFLSLSDEWDVLGKACPSQPNSTIFSLICLIISLLNNLFNYLFNDFGYRTPLFLSLPSAQTYPSGMILFYNLIIFYLLNMVGYSFK